MTSVFLGVDVGTTSTKCLAITEDGELLALAHHSYALSHPREGWAEQDAEEFVGAVSNVVKQCVTKCREKGCDASQIKALAMSTQGDTLIATDKAGNPILPAMSWMDGRAVDEYQELLTETGASFWYKQTGQPINPLSSVCKIRWIRKRYQGMANSMRFCWVADFLARRLCGKFVADVPSASWTPIYSPVRRSWSEPVQDLVGIDAEELPETAESGTVIGDLLPDVSDNLGLPRGTFLIAGAFDQAAAAHGAGASAGGRSVLSCGTAWVLYSVSDVVPIDKKERLCVCCHVNPSEWGLVLPFVGGSAYDWLNRTLADVSHEVSENAEPLIFVPHLYGELSPGWHQESKGSLLGLTMTHTREDIRLALMRGIAYETRRNLEAALELGGRVNSIRMVGGAGRSEFWPQLVADIINRPIEVSEFVDSACLGAAKLAAGNAATDWHDSHIARIYDPLPLNVSREDVLYKRYLAAHERLLGFYEDKDLQD